MDFKLTIISILFPMQLFCQHQTIESTIQRDYIIPCNYDGDIYYYNMNKFLLESSAWQNEPEISGNLAYFNFANKTITKTPIYSKADSINYIISIVKDNFNTIYTIRSLRNNANDLTPTFFLEKRTNDLSEVIESIQIDITFNIDRVITAFFDENNILQFKAFQSMPFFETFHYFIDTNGNVIDNFPTIQQGSVDYFAFHDINDSTYVSYLYSSKQIIYYKKDTFEIIKQVDLLNNASTDINENSKLFEDYLFLNGNYSPPIWNQPVRHVIFKHKIYSDTAIAIFIDSIPQEEAYFTTSTIDLIDTNYIYSGANFGNFCFADPNDNTCISSFKIYCVTSEGQLNWEKTIGGDANNWLFYVYATPDTGCFVMYYRNSEIDSTKNGDMYWIKYDKYGNEEPHYLDDFFKEQEIVPDKNESEIILYPNPNSGLLNFSNLSIDEFTYIKLYNSLGQLIYNSVINGNQIDISHIDGGVYFYQIYSDYKILKEGSLVKY